MKNKIPKPRFALPIIIACCISFNSFAQQNIIADVNNTHPEADFASARRAVITSFAVRQDITDNEISWTAIREEEVRKYIIEYSSNGVDYQSAGEMAASANTYSLKHFFIYDRPILYRIRAEQMNGKYFYSDAVLVAGLEQSAVQLYPTIVTGNTVNINAALPVEKVAIVNGSGQQLFSKDINGQRDYIPVVIPSLSKGMYWMVFYGRGWKTTEKFLIQ